jgi:hypothetical protein
MNTIALEIALKKKRYTKRLSCTREEFYAHKEAFLDAMFLADMSDDYFGRTLPEQAAARNSFQTFLHNSGWDFVEPKPPRPKYLKLKVGQTVWVKHCGDVKKVVVNEVGRYGKHSVTVGNIIMTASPNMIFLHDPMEDAPFKPGQKVHYCFNGEVRDDGEIGWVNPATEKIYVKFPPVKCGEGRYYYPGEVLSYLHANYRLEAI